MLPGYLKEFPQLNPPAVLLNYLVVAKYGPMAKKNNRCHAWGSLAYVLKPKLQKSGITIPKWDKRARVGMFMGFSKLHANSASLILNKFTCSITPQFHVVFDDYVTTISSHPNPEILL